MTSIERRSARPAVSASASSAKASSKTTAAQSLRKGAHPKAHRRAEARPMPAMASASPSATSAITDTPAPAKAVTSALAKSGPVAPRIGLHRAPASPERDAAVAACVDRVMARIDALPKAERIRAKVGQMIQYADGTLTGPARGKLGGFEQLIREGQIGSFFYIEPEHVERYQKIAVEESPLGIPLLFAWDVIHGLHTTFPIPLAIASSWNPQMAYRTAEVSGREAAEAGIHWTFAPMVDIARDPRWGRVAEGAGEDQFLGARIAEGYIKGFKEYVLTCAKHFAAYGAIEGGRDYNTTDMSLRRLHDVYLPPFLAAFKAGVDTVMTSFNDLNGVPPTASPYLLKTVLREQAGSNAVVVTDYDAVDELINHGVARTRSAAAVTAANAGVDIDMQSAVFAEELAKAVMEDKVPEANIDASCRRILRLKAEMGLFDDPMIKPQPRSPIDRESARQVAEESVVLLKNDGTLPLKPSKKIALVGAMADLPRDHRGCWDALGKDGDVTTIRKGLEERAAKAGGEVIFTPGIDREGVATSASIDAAVAAAKDSDVVVVVIGENSDRSGEASSLQSIELEGNQRELIKALQERTGKPVVAVMMNGRPLALPPECDKLNGLIEGWQLGSEMGSAIANVLYGDKNPSGKLPISFPVSTGQIPVHHQMVNTGRPLSYGPDGKPGDEKYASRYLDGSNQPKFPFGFGLSYTTFNVGAPTLSKTTLGKDETLFIDVPVKNTGTVKGKETVQIYSHWEDAPLTQPLRKLAGYAQVELAPGESRVVRIALPISELTVHDNDGKPLPPDGAYKLYVGTDATCKTETSFRVR